MSAPAAMDVRMAEDAYTRRLKQEIAVLRDRLVKSGQGVDVRPGRTKVVTTVYLDAGRLQLLREYSERSGIKVAQLIRNGADELLKKAGYLP